ncbi:MAG: translation initiation factor 2 [Lachnospiraceae bacterium]|nr:translation initiation factor 2 [Lachnospiraceae bacterium]
MSNKIIFIEENNNFIFSKEFAEFVKRSGNYFVFVNRAPLRMLPYSIHEVYEIAIDGQHADLKESWHTFRELYSNFPMPEYNRTENVLTEDSNSGFEFFSSVFWKSMVTSAGGNSNIPEKIDKTGDGDLLVIADGAAFGAIMEDCIETLENHDNKRITLWLPESFEYLILKSGIISTPELDMILESIPDYADSKQYISWEQFFTDLLIHLTKDTLFPYSKHHLGKYYMTGMCKQQVIKEFPEAIRENLL